MVIAEGQFNEIGNINIKVDKKTGEKGQFLEKVVMHIKSEKRLGNFKVIIAEMEFQVNNLDFIDPNIF